MSKYLLRKYLRIFSEFNSKTLESAGPRYTPLTEPGFPHVPIEELNLTFGLIKRDSLFYTQIKKHLDEFERKQYLSLHFPVQTEKSIELTNDAKNINAILNKIVKFLKHLYLIRSISDRINILYLKQLCSKCNTILCKLNEEYENVSRAPKEYSDNGIVKDENISALGSVTSSENDIYYVRRNIISLFKFLESNGSKLLNNPHMLLTGKAGIGKTHFLCDIAKSQIDNKIPALVTLATDYNNIKDPFQSLIENLKLNISKKQFLSSIDKIGTIVNQRILIMFDAVNEGNKLRWRKNLSKLISDLKHYRNIALVISCRDPFQNYIIPRSSKLIQIVHPGFTGVEMDAQTEFFDFYDLPQPEIPLLTEEFSNPLFLKMMCKVLKNLKKGKHKFLKDIASGQVGMTKILEDYVKNTSEKIVNKYTISRNFIWELYKEIAQRMGEDKQEYLSLERVLELIPYKQKKEIVTETINEGMLLEHLEYNASKNDYELVIKFPYQKFSDHLIARYLLKKYVPDIKSLKTSLTSKIIVEKLFRVNEYEYYDFNLLEALMIEFPVRFKEENTELLDYLPDDNFNFDIISTFTNSLLFRKVESFNESTKKWINIFLQEKYFNLLILDSLVTLSTKSGHPLGIDKLDSFLRSMPLPKRDLLWSEYIRKYYAIGAFDRILRWFEKSERKISAEQALTFMKILMWLQTTTRNVTRDRASRALFFLGRSQPKLFFNLTIDCLTIDDPYIHERMISVSYGIVLTLVKDGRQKTNLIDFAKNLYNNLFKKGAPHYTNHILLRDNAGLTLITINEKYKIFSKHDEALFTFPLKPRRSKNFHLNKKITDQMDIQDRYPLGTDFGNYTVGSMFNGRMPYTNDFPGFMETIDLMQSRIYGLGYNKSNFVDVERDISSNSNSGNEELGKTETYEKKYAWIAFYEIYGMRKDKGLIERDFINEPRHYPIFIDPTFPKEPKTDNFITSNFLGNKNQTDESWIKKFPFQIKNYIEVKDIFNINSPWLLLEGRISRENIVTGRHLFIKMYTVFVDAKDLTKIPPSYYSKYVHRLDSLFSFGDIQAHSIYAGEIPNSKIYPEITISEAEIPIFKKKRKAENFKILKSGLEIVGKEKRKIIIEIVKFIKDKAKLQEYFKENHLSIQKSDEEDKYDVSNLSIKNLPTVLDVSWSNFQSSMVNIASIQFPIKNLMKSLKNNLDINSFELKDESDKNITRYIINNSDTFNGEHLLYIRKDLLTDYMKSNSLSLLMLVHGSKFLHTKRSSIYEKRSYHINEVKDFKKIYLLV